MEKKLVKEASGSEVSAIVKMLNDAVDVRLSFLAYHLMCIVTALDDMGIKASLYEHPEGFFSIDIYCLADDVCYTIHSKNVKEVSCQDG